MIDIRDRIYQAHKEGDKIHFTYYNLQKNIWSEWGYLNFMIPYPVTSLNTELDLRNAVDNHNFILVPGDEWLADMESKLHKLYGNFSYSDKTPWRRWKTKGKNAEGVPLWQAAWNKQDISLLEHNFYIVQVKPKPNSN